MSTTPETTPIKKCTNHIRGCRVILTEDYKRKKCEECLRVDRERDHKRRHAVKEIAPTQENHKICSTCCQEYPMDHFQGLLGETKTCQACRENNKKQDEKRDKEHINALSRVNSKKPERIATKNEWKENNKEKCVEYYDKFRQRQIEENPEEYLKRNAENQRRWRENNPERTAQLKENSRNNPASKFTNYKREACKKNLAFELTFEQFESFVRTPCYYCNEFTANCEINGVDRLDSTKPYILDNCVPSCKMCNMMKNTLNEYTFMARIEHILVFQGIVTDGQFHPEAFTNYLAVAYSSYQNRAMEKEIEFEINFNDYRNLVAGNCYLCGKASDENHRNGIDRFDSQMGYVHGNCRSCCANCNFLKKDYPFQELIRKMNLIHTLHKGRKFDSTPMSKYMARSNKKTVAEQQRHSELKRDQRIEALAQRYTDEEIKKRAAEIAQVHKDKKKAAQPAITAEIEECVATLEYDF